MTRWDDLFDKPPPGRGPASLALVDSSTAPAGTSSYALAALRSEANLVAGAANGTRNHTLNKAWFNMGRHVGAGSIDASTVRSTLAAAAIQSGLDQHEIDVVLRDDDTSALRNGVAHPRRPSPMPDLPGVTVLEDLTPEAEDEFWSSRELLTHLHDYARARIVSPWAVLGTTLARIITATPFDLGLPPTVGSRASLNLFVGLVGPSGSGKGAAENVAAEALSVGYITSHNVGSGEGIGHGYMAYRKGNLDWLDDVHAVLFSIPEIDAFAALGDRKGATLMPQLRSAWSGEQLGFGYADPTKRIIVPAHEYRLCIVAGIQPARARALLDDTDGGTPQRFLWLPATDADVPDTEPDCPAPRSWHMPALSSLRSAGGRNMGVCETARTTIIEARRARIRGDGEALDGHALLTRLKTAAALALMDGRLEVTDEDWNLSGTIMAKSDATREGCRRVLSSQVTASNEARAEAEATRAILVAERTADAAVKRVCVVIRRRLHREGDWMTRNDIRKGVAGRDRGLYDEAIGRLLDAGTVEVETAGNVTKYRLMEDK